MTAEKSVCLSSQLRRTYSEPRSTWQNSFDVVIVAVAGRGSSGRRSVLGLSSSRTNSSVAQPVLQLTVRQFSVQSPGDKDVPFDTSVPEQPSS